MKEIAAQTAAGSASSMVGHSSQFRQMITRLQRRLRGISKVSTDEELLRQRFRGRTTSGRSLSAERIIREREGRKVLQVPLAGRHQEGSGGVTTCPQEYERDKEAVR